VTVGELIKELIRLDPSLPVLHANDNGDLNECELMITGPIEFGARGPGAHSFYSIDSPLTKNPVGPAAVFTQQAVDLGSYDLEKFLNPS